MKYVIGILLPIIILVALSVLVYVNTANYGNEQENLIKATYIENQNILAQYGQKVIEAAEVPDMMRDDTIKVAQAAIGGRYGQGGSKAVFQMLKEQNPQLDPSLYKQIQQIVESGRNDFEEGQKKLIDIELQYNTALGTVVKGSILKYAGYPKIDLTKYQPVTTDRAKDSFKSGVEKPIQIR